MSSCCKTGGGVPDHLQADFGRWLRQSDEEHKELASEVGISLDSGPGAARAALAALDANVLADRGVIIAGDPESCLKTIRMYEEIGVDQVLMIMQTETIPHEKGDELHRNVRQVCDTGGAKRRRTR